MVDKVKKNDRKGDRSTLYRSLLCGLCVSMTCVLRPVLSFYLQNEGEFWFSLGSIIGQVLMIAGGVAGFIMLVHFILPEREKINARLLFGSLAAALSLCVYIQNHFLSFYLPILTGDPINWSLYYNWNIVSVALWSVVFAVAVVGALKWPRQAKSIVYMVFAMLLCAECVSCGIEIITAKHDNKREDAYFSENGLYEVSNKENIIVLISDTFEGTYMNEILERYPEYQDMLSDCTYYDNVTGTSCFTYFSYADMMTGVDFPLGNTEQSGVSYCFDHQTTIDKISNNGWDIEYYTVFSPTESVSSKILNAFNGVLTPDWKTSWYLAKLLFKSTLFQSMPQPLKPRFIVLNDRYEDAKQMVKSQQAPLPYVSDDIQFYNQINKPECVLKGIEGKPRYIIVELWGVHEPSRIDADFNEIEFDDSVSIDERKIQGARAQLKLLRTYLDQLKAAGIYDQSTVIMTADHGYNLRFYPVFLVKEAHREADSFIIDHSPISLRADYEDLLEKMTSGQSLSETISAMKLPSDRVRYAVDYSSSEGYAKLTDRRSIVTIMGDAREDSSYRIEKDEFYMDDGFEGRCKIDEDFYTGGNSNGNAAIYGLRKDAAQGHSIVFDMFLDQESETPLIFKTTIQNAVDQPQRVNLYANGELIKEEILESMEPKEISIEIPDRMQKRIAVELIMPDAKRCELTVEALGWNAYESIRVLKAGLYSYNS